MAMRKMYLAVLMCILVTALSGCGEKNSPGATVERFLKAVRSQDVQELENTLSFERLMVEKEGERYLNLVPDQRVLVLQEFRRNMIKNLTTGNLKFFGEIDAKIRNERISGDMAEVVISNRKIKDTTYAFALVRERGEWKIYRITFA